MKAYLYTLQISAHINRVLKLPLQPDWKDTKAWGRNLVLSVNFMHSFKKWRNKPCFARIWLYPFWSPEVTAAVSFKPFLASSTGVCSWACKLSDSSDTQKVALSYPFGGDLFDQVHWVMLSWVAAMALSSRRAFSNSYSTSRACFFPFVPYLPWLTLWHSISVNIGNVFWIRDFCLVKPRRKC